MIPRTQSPGYEITIKVPTLADALDEEISKKQKFQNIRTKYGRPDMKDRKAPTPQWEGDNES